MNSPAWASRKRRWFREHWERTHEPAVCVVCGERPVDLHHLDYGKLGDEDYESIVPVCRRDHDRIHAAWEATPHVRRLGRRAATVLVIADAQADSAFELIAAAVKSIALVGDQVFHFGTPDWRRAGRTGDHKS